MRLAGTTLVRQRGEAALAEPVGTLARAAELAEIQKLIDQMKGD